MVMATLNIKIWETDDDVDQDDEIYAYENYFWFVVNNDQEPSPLH